MKLCKQFLERDSSSSLLHSATPNSERNVRVDNAVLKMIFSIILCILEDLLHLIVREIMRKWRNSEKKMPGESQRSTRLF